MVSKNIIVTLFVTAAAAVPQTGLPRKLLTTLREPATLSCLVILPTQPSRSLVTPIIYMLLPMVAEPVSDRHSSGVARISRTGP